MKPPAAARVDLGPRRSYDVAFAPLAELPRFIRGAGIDSGRCLVVTDTNVERLYGGIVREELSSSGYEPTVITLPAGERTKSIRQLEVVYDLALRTGVERGTPLLALGGGVIGDLAGFAAATLLRGLPLFQLPTTLIAQVDSAIGGKTGINHDAGKNLIGAFHQPRAVMADPSVLQTLPQREWTGGLAEVVKHGLIADEELVSELESSWEDVIDRQDGVLRRIVPRAAGVKIRVVSEDELENGLREILNFGHTFAHAIERVSGYGTYSHGEAVAAGMRAAIYVSRRLQPGLDGERADRIVGRIPVPPGLASLDVRELTAAMKSDKKVRGGRIRLVLLDRIGSAYVTDEVPIELIEEAWAYASDVVG